jgi:hypothetical protein
VDSFPRVSPHFRHLPFHFGGEEVETDLDQHRIYFPFARRQMSERILNFMDGDKFVRLSSAGPSFMRRWT